MDYSGLAMKLEISGDIPGVLAEWLDGLGRKADLPKQRALEDRFLHQVLDLSMMLFRHDHETSSLHPEADVGTLAIINGSLGNRRHHNMLVTGSREQSGLSHMDPKGAAVWVNLFLRSEQRAGSEQHQE
jgi:hypothetical protein